MSSGLDQKISAMGRGGLQLHGREVRNLARQNKSDFAQQQDRIHVASARHQANELATSGLPAIRIRPQTKLPRMLPASPVAAAKRPCNPARSQRFTLDRIPGRDTSNCIYSLLSFLALFSSEFSLIISTK